MGFSSGSRLRGKERMILRSIRKEHFLKDKAKKFGKRFRSWTQLRIRQYRMNIPVALTTDKSLIDTMDGQYIAAAFQKAAALRKHDLTLWHMMSNRAIEIAPALTPDHIGFIMYGLGKSGFYKEEVYNALIKRTLESLDDFYSHPLMCVAWAMHQVGHKDEAALAAIAEAACNKISVMRPRDFIKIANACARFGVDRPALWEKISECMLVKLEEASGQVFRNVLNDVAIVDHYTPELKKYILTRYHKVFITGRPQHHVQAYRAAVGVRVLHPDVWADLTRQTRAFYIRLSLRAIKDAQRKPTGLHWEVSKALADNDIWHRNSFRWGCYWVDIGETAIPTDPLAEEDVEFKAPTGEGADTQTPRRLNARTWNLPAERACWSVDGPNAFYRNTLEYTSTRKLHHKVMSELGWDVRRVNWMEWAALGDDVEAKQAFILGRRSAPALGKELEDDKEVTKEEVKQALADLRVSLKSKSEAKKAANTNQIEFDF